MTDLMHEQPPPWNERAASRLRLRMLGWMAALLFHPFIYVFPVYRALDATYQNAREPCGGYDSYAGCLKRAFEDLRNKTVYHCQVDSENPIPSTHERELVETVGRASRVSVPLSRVHSGVSGWIFRRDLPLFRQGFKFREISAEAAQKGRSITDKRLKHCEEQRIHFLRDESVEPIAIYGEVRDLLRETARRFDEAIAEYERIRFLFGFLMWGWAAFELAGVVLFVGIVRADFVRHQRLKAGQADQHE